MALPSHEWKKSDVARGSHSKRSGRRIIVGNHQETKSYSRDGIAIRGVPFPTGNVGHGRLAGRCPRDAGGPLSLSSDYAVHPRDKLAGLFVGGIVDLAFDPFHPRHNGTGVF